MSKTPEEIAAFKAKMAAAKAAKKAARLDAAGSTVVVERPPKKKPKPAEKAKPRVPSDGDLENSGSGGDDGGWLL